MHEALREDGVLHHADAGGEGKERRHLGLHIGGVLRVRVGENLAAAGAFAGGNEHGGAVLVVFHAVAAFDEQVGNSLHVRAAHAVNHETIAHHGGGYHEGAGLDAVRNDGVVAAVQLLHAVNSDGAGAGAFDAGTHLVQEIGQVHHLGLAGGGFDDGGALGEHGSHHDVVRAQHGGAAVATHINRGADEAVRGIDNQVAALYLHAGAQRLDAADVEVHRAVADNAAAGQGKHALLHAGHERAEQADGGAHLAYLFVGSFVGDALRGFNAYGAAGALYRAAQLAENLQHVVGVGYIRHAGDAHGLIGEQGCCENGERCVFGTTDIDGATESGAAFNDEFVHGVCVRFAGLKVCI